MPSFDRLLSGLKKNPRVVIGVPIVGPLGLIAIAEGVSSGDSETLRYGLVAVAVTAVFSWLAYLDGESPDDDVR